MQWRNSRINLMIDCLQNINWVPERDAKLSLEPEIKPLAKRTTALLSMVGQPGEYMVYAYLYMRVRTAI